MDKIILVDGNNLLFRSYYATAYNGNFMKNSKGFPTNALFGFANMMNKIINEEKPKYIMVAFDKGKTFRHDKYDFYKGGRIETPDELKQQFPFAKKMLNLMGIKYYEIDNYEADDIIGTFAQFCDNDINVIGTIISSDKDLLQLISSDIDIKLLKQKDYIRYNEMTFKDEYGINPINIIDLKALMGDSSDNIPGVKGIGEKTALKLLQEYKNLEGIYSNIDNIKGKLQEKLLTYKNDAYMSYEIATIYKQVPIEIKMDELIYNGSQSGLNNLYEELEFYSFLKKEKVNKTNDKIEYKILDDINTDKPIAVYLEVLGTNYHEGEIIGLGIYNEEVKGFLPLNKIKDNISKLNKLTKYTYDYKKMYVALKYLNIEIINVEYDNMIAAYLLEYNVKEDIAVLANAMNYSIEFYENIYGKGNKLAKPSIDIIANNCIEKAKYIYETRKQFIDRISDSNLNKIFYEIEMPLSKVLGDMEYNGVCVDINSLDQMGMEINKKLDYLKIQIYNNAGCEFNISSPIQLSEVLFEKLNLPHGKKGKTGYSTSVEVLNKLKNTHSIIDLILEYRTLTKLYSTYVEGLKSYIHKDGKIHTIFNQTLTTTGRLSSIEPNLQNIPIRYEYGRLIRKAFIPSKDSIILSGDYSQIELRIMAHMANVTSLINAFNNNIDIHTKTASDIFNIPIEGVTKDMRRMAKAVNFGIIYGISEYGLSENTGITIKEAKKFINDYLDTYSEIKDYMNNTIKKAHIDKYVKTMFGRKRTINELDNKNYMIRTSGERMALNTPIQGTSADIIKLAMIKISNEFKKNNIKSKMIIQVHDELIFDCYKDEYEKVYEIVKNCMENIVKLNVPLVVELADGDNWYSAHE